MESEEASSDTRVTVNLVMHNYTTSVNKNKAVEFSNYFSSLFSGNFSDHNFKVHQIKYDISVEIFQTYIDWIENTQPENYSSIYRQPEKSLTNIANNYDNLLELLKTSVVFMSDKLTYQLSRIITTKWLNLDTSLDIWKFAEDHGLYTLKDLAFEFCLDRISQFRDQLMKLPAKKFHELITNSNVNHHKYNRESLILAFLKGNEDSIDPVQKQLLEVADSITGLKPEYSQCLVTCKLNETEKKRYCVYFLKERELVELVDFKEMFDYLDDGREVVGRKIVGRRFSIYVIGGEKGLGTGQFIKSIWRYCLISRTWYYVTELLTPRRHMVAEFLDENLYLIGGVGNFRVKLSSVDILNVYTNGWKEGKEIPEVFTEIPPSCVVGRLILYYSTYCYAYNKKFNDWETLPNNPGPCYALTGDPVEHEICSFYSLPCDSQYNVKHTMIKYTIKDFAFRLSVTHSCIKKVFNKSKYNRHIFNKPLLVSFSFEDGKIFVERGTVKNTDYEVNDSFCQQVDNINPSLFSNQLGCFNVINPDTLYRKFFD